MVQPYAHVIAIGMMPRLVEPQAHKNGTVYLTTTAWRGPATVTLTLHGFEQSVYGSIHIS